MARSKRKRSPFALDPSRRRRFEAAARREHPPLAVSTRGAQVTYRLAIGVPGTLEEIEVRAVVTDCTPREAHVTVTGPVCGRHRYVDRSLCMWVDSDPDERRWRIADGLLRLIEHIRYHAACEALCRTGEPWPKDESPGDHPRPASCPSCGGIGA